MKCIIELYHTYGWHKAACVEVKDSDLHLGYKAPSAVTYLDNYIEGHLEQSGSFALSPRYPVRFDYYIEDRWPPFLLDLLPSGAARRYWLSELGIQDGPTADWELLVRGAGNPTGNLRVAEAVTELLNAEHLGFSKEEVIEKRENFIAYAREHGAPVSGSSGAQGDSPKFLLTQDNDTGNWHADGALLDKRAAKHWIVKFPRGRSVRDSQVLKNEAVYMQVAKEFGVKVGELPQYDNDTLFIPRFDREVCADGVKRYGLESLASIAGIGDFGVFAKHEELIPAIARCVTHPNHELTEYLLRDLLNLALLNTDNHVRNTAFIKSEDGTVTLSPLFDFAPMFLDPEGIPRVSRWGDERGRIPDWEYVLTQFGAVGADTAHLRAALVKCAERVSRLPSMLGHAGADGDIIERVKPSVAELERSLVALRKKA